jgi:membrane-associated protease RseP (regulator of RpoE activity)
MSEVIGILIGLALGAIAHEAGHFAFSAIGPISIKLVSVGAGPVVLRGRLGKTDLELRALPVGLPHLVNDPFREGTGVVISLRPECR